MSAVRSTRHRTVVPGVATLFALTLVAACGGDSEDESSASETVTVTASPDQETSASPSASASPTPPETTSASPETGELAGLPPRPARDECVDIRVRQDGRYTVYEAGTAVVRRDGSRLVVGQVTPSQGWTSRVDDREPDEVEIEFRKSPRNELDLEVEIDDGRVEVQICADDD